MWPTSLTMKLNPNESMKSFLYLLTFASIVGSHSVCAQASSTVHVAPGVTQDSSRIDSLKEISIAIRKIPYYYNYPLLGETLYDVTTLINKATNPNFSVGPIPTTVKEVNYGELAKESVASMKDILARIQAISGYQESRFLLDASRSMTAAIGKAQPTKERSW
jgi:hypothetical protein